MSLHNSFWQQVVAVFEASNIQSAAGNGRFFKASPANMSNGICAKGRRTEKKIKQKKLLKPIYLT